MSGCCFLALLEAAAAAKIRLKMRHNWISSRIPEGTFRPPGNLILRLLLCHFRREIRWCFAVSAVFRKRCLAAGFLLYSCFIRGSSSSQKWRSKLDF